MTQEDTNIKLGCRNRAFSQLKDMYPEDFERLYKAELKLLGLKRRRDMTKMELKEYEINRLKNKLKDLQG